MDTRVSLLKSFSKGFIPDTVKIETEQHGFGYLEHLLADGVQLEYGELTPTRLLHKYKLTGVSGTRLDDFLREHVAKTCNVCRYFGAETNDVLCFNLDNNHKQDNVRIIPEMTLAVRALEKELKRLGVEPLIVASGRGYHVWCRLETSVENTRLSAFMLNVAVRALMAFHQSGYDHQTVKFNFYPDPKIINTVSLRLFGSNHAKNKTFSQVLSSSGLLDEPESWAFFEDFLTRKTITLAQFASAENAAQTSLTL
ncbi:MAG TPA: hypothetical protein VIM69_03070 [Opitutaceae bacterium]